MPQHEKSAKKVYLPFIQTPKQQHLAVAQKMTGNGKHHLME